MQQHKVYLSLLCFFLSGPLVAQSIRDRTRPTWATGTEVSESQASDLTLTLTQASARPVQTWVRTAGTIDKEKRTLVARLHPPESEFVKVGQRIRAFPPESRSSVYQARVTRILPQNDGAIIEATLSGAGRDNANYYVMEIITERGVFLSVPNEAIIEEGGKRIVYVQQHPGHYVPQEIHTGIQGELYTEVVHGLEEGAQVVTFGSFFIDSEFKLKSGGQNAMSNAQHNH
jgi:Cu(I)/Ag(I) efflux system membrane fusion protein